MLLALAVLSGLPDQDNERADRQADKSEAMTTTMTCRNCGANLEAGRIDHALGIVTCAHCGSLHELARAADHGRDAGTPGAGTPEAGTPEAGAPAAAAAPRPPPAQPARFDVQRGAGSLQVRWPKGGKAGAVILFLVGLMWGGAALSSGLVFLLPVALAILYAAVVRGVNRITLRADRSRVSVSKGPLPWPGARRVPRADIAQLFAREHVRRVRKESNDGGPARVETRRSYQLRMKKPDGGERTLVGGLRRAEHALWLEHEIEKTLGIENLSVPGEYR